MKTIPEIKLKLIPKSTDTKIGFKYADHVNESKIGGHPDWIQDDETPICPSCKKKMVFFAQLDSINDKIIIGDLGMIYVFYCFECMESDSLVQFY